MSDIIPAATAWMQMRAEIGLLVEVDTQFTGRPDVFE